MTTWWKDASQVKSLLQKETFNFSGDSDGKLENITLGKRNTVNGDVVGHYQTWSNGDLVRTMVTKNKAQKKKMKKMLG